MLAERPARPRPRERPRGRRRQCGRGRRQQLVLGVQNLVDGISLVTWPNPRALLMLMMKTTPSPSRQRCRSRMGTRPWRRRGEAAGDVSTACPKHTKTMSRSQCCVTGCRETKASACWNTGRSVSTTFKKRVTVRQSRSAPQGEIAFARTPNSPSEAAAQRATDMITLQSVRCSGGVREGWRVAKRAEEGRGG